MRNVSGYVIIGSSGLFILYFANVVVGTMGVQMSLLFTACIVVVIGILRLEKDVKLSPSEIERA